MMNARSTIQYMKTLPYIIKTIHIGILCLILLTTQSCAVIIPASILGAAATTVANDNRSIGIQIDDNVIHSKVRQKVKSSLPKDHPSVSVTVMEGRILITGCIKNIAYRHKITKSAWEVIGVKEVINETKKCSMTHNENARDIIIANQVRGRLLIEKKVSSHSYSVDCVHREVYIIGMAATNEEKQKVLSVAKSISGVKSIVSHIILKNDPRRWNRI